MEYHGDFRIRAVREDNLWLGYRILDVDNDDYGGSDLFEYDGVAGF